jgi:DNA-binding MarR family transcriptional regulator
MSDNVRWLNEDEQATWRAFLEANRIVFEQIETQLQHQSGVPHTYYEILVRLSEAPDRSLRMSELASRSFSSRSRLSHAVGRLSEMGWVERVDCPTDRRGQIARLTDKGFAGLAQAAPGHVETVRKRVFDALTPEQVVALRSISEALLKNAGETCTLADEN